MTPSQIILAARRRYNAVGDTLWSDDEHLQMIDQAQMELAREALCIERVYTTTTVAGTQDYDFPTNTIAIKKVYYDGKPLTPVSLDEDDTLTVFNNSTSTQGVPSYYTTWDNTISLRAIPSDALTLKLYTYNEPQQLTAVTAVLEVPALFHNHIVNFLVAEMYAKDENPAIADRYIAKWEKGKLEARMWFQRKKRTNKFTTVKDEEQLQTRPVGFL